MRYIELTEGSNVPVLYHGTCEEYSDRLLKYGWSPRGIIGGNGGQGRYLYLSTGYEDALWFAQEKGCSVVLAVRNVPIDYLIVDPEDGISDTVEQELSTSKNFPGKVALTRPLGSDHFELCKGVMFESVVSYRVFWGKDGDVYGSFYVDAKNEREARRLAKEQMIAMMMDGYKIMYMDVK